MVPISGTNSINKEMNIRRRMASIFNKREEDFPSLREYNDYLEEVEDMTFKLIEEGVDPDAIEARIAQYKKENGEQIANTQTPKAEETAALEARKEQPAQIDSDAGTSQSIVAGLQSHDAPAIAGDGLAQPLPTSPSLQQPVPIGPGPDKQGDAFEDEETTRLRAERAAKAGGWSEEFNKKRSLEEAFGSIF